MRIRHFLENSKSLLALAYPILIAQVIQNLMGFADTVMAGRVSAIDMAAVAVASSIWLPLILTINGLTMALTSIVSQLNGAKKPDKIADNTYQCAWIALTLSIGIIVIYYQLRPYLYHQIELEQPLKSLLFDYLNYVVWGAPGFALYLVLRNFCEGLSHTKPSMIISIIGLVINIPANYIFIYGKFGAPALGGAGCGVATAIVYWAMFLGLIIYCLISKKIKPYHLFRRFYWPHKRGIKAIFSLGTPIALSLLFEVSLFSVVAIILAPLGANIVASHQIAINFSGLVFMVPLSLSIAVTIKVAFALGNDNHHGANKICANSYLLGFLIAVFTASFTLLFSETIAQIYTSDQDVIALAASLMLLAALFQFSDFIQVISAGALRGYKDTKAILYITFFAYWLVGLSLGYILGMTNLIVPAVGAAGFWIGFIVGLSVAAVLLFWRLKIIQRRHDMMNNKNPDCL